MSVSSTTGASSTTTAGSPPLVVNGLISGINTSSVITALLSSYAQPITSLQDEQSSLNSTASDYQTLASDMQGVSAAATALDTSSKWNLMTATSSDQGVATPQAAAGAQAGSMSFMVNALAQANVFLSQGSVASTGSVVTSQPSFLIATGAEALGLSELGSASLTPGSHSIEVTQASRAASISGSALAASTTITAGSNDTLDLAIDGSPVSLTLAAGTYDAAQLGSAVTAAAKAAGAAVSAAVDGSGRVTLSSDAQGSAATLGVVGGSALTTLGLATGTAAGTDAVISVDGTATTLISIKAGQSTTLQAPTGTITAQVGAAPSGTGSLISSGSAKAAEVATGNGSLSSVIQAINNSGLPLTASAIEPTSGRLLLQMGANQTGLSGAVSVDPNAFSAGSLSQMGEIASAQDASVSVGGAGGYTLTSSNDTFSTLLAGTTVTVASQGTATVSVTPDASATASAVSSLVSAANQALGDINSLTAYNAATKSGGPLMGSPVVSALQQQLLSIFGTEAGASSLANSAAAGISLNSDGTLRFDQTKFEQAFSQNPGGVAALFTQGGSFTASAPAAAGQVSLLYAGQNTAPGSYDVAITQSATQALDSGSVLSGGAVSTPETLTIAANAKSASFTTSAGQSLVDIAAGLNSAFADNGVLVTASVAAGGQQLQLVANDFGANAGFSVTSDTAGANTTGLGSGIANAAASYAGLDVAGTINGVAATGNGQVLSAPESDPALNGLSLDVTVSGVTSATDLGSFSYTPGVAQRLAALSVQMTTAKTGELASEVSGLQNEATGLNSRIANYQALEASQQKLLQSEFAKMETTLGSLKDQSASITNQLTAIAANP